MEKLYVELDNKQLIKEITEDEFTPQWTPSWIIIQSKNHFYAFPRKKVKFIEVKKVDKKEIYKSILKDDD